MQLPEIPLNPPLRKGETPCLRRTHVKTLLKLKVNKGEIFAICRIVRTAASSPPFYIKAAEGLFRTFFHIFFGLTEYSMFLLTKTCC